MYVYVIRCHDHSVVVVHAGEVTLVCLGPLTNLALALKLDPELGQNLKNVVIMGGNTEGAFFT